MQTLTNRSFVFRLVFPLVLWGVVLATPSQAGQAVKFFGTAQAGELSPHIAAAVEESGIDVSGFGCFEAPLLDLSTGRQVGTGLDCLNPFDTLGDAHGAGLQIEAITFFFLPQGLIVNHGCTSVRPFFGGVGDSGVTHMSGSIGPAEFGASPNPGPPECGDTGGIILATRGFRNHTGSVRLSGAVDLSNAGSGEITFSCIFVIDVAPGGRDDEDEDEDDERPE